MPGEEYRSLIPVAQNLHFGSNHSSLNADDKLGRAGSLVRRARDEEWALAIGVVGDSAEAEEMGDESFKTSGDALPRSHRSSGWDIGNSRHPVHGDDGLKAEVGVDVCGRDRIRINGE